MVAKQAVKTEQARRRRARDPVTSLAPPYLYRTHLDTRRPRPSASHSELPLVYHISTTLPFQTHSTSPYINWCTHVPLHTITVLRQQACKTKAAAARPLLQPQPQPQPQPQAQPQPQPQPQLQTDAQAKAVAQHAKAQRAQAEFRRLQAHFAQLQHPSMAKCPAFGSARDRLFCACSKAPRRLWAARYFAGDTSQAPSYCL